MPEKFPAVPFRSGFRNLALASLALLVLVGCGGKPKAAVPTSATGPQQREAALAPFTKGVQKVTDGVYVALGYSLANSILIEGDDGVIIVDALEGRPQAEEVKAAFRAVTPKPVKALILTHNHADHIFGGRVFTEDRADIPVYAHESTAELIDKTVSLVAPASYVRSLRMFGQCLDPGRQSSCAIGPKLDYHAENIALARPTVTFHDKLEVTIAGVRLVLFHAPGETPDQIAVWLPDKRVLIPADNIYEAFPNLYTIRGTTNRDVMSWVNSLDAMRDLEADFLVPCHTRPLAGKEAIAATLTDYRDAIQFVHDQTVRNMNRGLSPDEIVQAVRLPEHLARHPWLQERYGEVAWSVRGIYDGYLGWFNGDAAQLNPLPPAERAGRYAAAFAQGKPLAEQARSAYAAREYQWGAELARLWTQAEPASQEAKEALAACLEAIAGAEGNLNAYNYCLTQAGELRGSIKLTPPDTAVLPDDFVDSLPVESFMRALPTRLDPEKARDTDLCAVFHFTDVNEEYTVHVRKGVAELRKRAVIGPDLDINTTAKTWKRIVLKKTSPVVAFASGNIGLHGGVTDIVRFLGLFNRD